MGWDDVIRGEDGCEDKRERAGAVIYLSYLLGRRMARLLSK